MPITTKTNCYLLSTRSVAVSKWTWKRLAFCWMNRSPPRSGRTSTNDGYTLTLRIRPPVGPRSCLIRTQTWNTSHRIARCNSVWLSEWCAPMWSKPVALVIMCPVRLRLRSKGSIGNRLSIEYFVEFGFISLPPQPVALCCKFSHRLGGPLRSTPIDANTTNCALLLLSPYLCPPFPVLEDQFIHWRTIVCSIYSFLTLNVMCLLYELIRMLLLLVNGCNTLQVGPGT